ncbi:putative conserved membrane protein [Synechococcus sp. BOUM118]|nr:putative conserved membrane protein [Synechococcus sp. RS9915]QNI92281.1 putative conserved membrane protein [Synechococcus sp. BOUM118]
MFQSMASDQDQPFHSEPPAHEEQEEPFSPGSPSLVMAGLSIALLSITAPMLAVISDRGSLPTRLMPTALDRDGSQPPVPLTVLRPGQSSGGDPRWKPQ